MQAKIKKFFMAKKIKNKPFKDWLYEEVSEEFGLKRGFEHSLFDHFQKISSEIDQKTQESITELQNLAQKYVDAWNEDEYKFMFISRFIGLAGFVSEHYKVFTQRPMSVMYAKGTKKTEGLVEFMLAKGIQTPKKPHFFLHEYKPEKRRDNDPLGQLLIAMVAAKVQNQDDKAIYGMYVNGRNWHLVILEQQNYYVSNPYVITDVGIFQLFRVLLYFKNLMEKIYAQ
ncbi:MAG: hypothetical protein EAZ97_00580 [Bacteroidetes bacterium]|nr:MAG: hypothetical protein EAZ97_00580 [Bacteroidota bacterium]